MGSTSGPTRRRGWSRPPRVAAARRLAGGRALGVGRGSEVHNTYVSLTCRLRVRRARPPHVLQLYTVYAPILFAAVAVAVYPPHAKTARLRAAFTTTSRAALGKGGKDHPAALTQLPFIRSPRDSKVLHAVAAVLVAFAGALSGLYVLQLLGLET